ncbi:MAG: hypothetical protein GX493_01040 [Firmicutes bacterium]|nr:hypothetical protein [Bacillota bacterium]
MASERKHPVLLHIEDAEAWLARAREHYRTAAVVRGELDLSLAQAEVRYAWELSRKGRTGEGARVETRRPRPDRRWFPWVAAAGIFLFTFVFFLGGWPRSVPRKTPPVAQNLSGTPERKEETWTPTVTVRSSPPATVTKAKKVVGEESKKYSPSPPSPPSSPEAVRSSVAAVIDTGEEPVPAEEVEGVQVPVASSAGAEIPVAEKTPGSAEREVLPPREELRPALLDLAELERVAREILRPDREITPE